MDAWTVDRWTVVPGFVERVPLVFARRFGVIALIDGDGTSWIAHASEEMRSHANTVARTLGVPAAPIVLDAAFIQAKIDHAYQARDGGASELLAILSDEETSTDSSTKLGEDLLQNEGRATVIRFVNEVLLEAIRAGASDVHFQPYEQQLMVRLRIDGVLFDLYEVPQGSQEEVLSRLKILGRMNIAEKRLPQDGRASVQVGSKQIDLRIASMPTNFGERIVIRLLDKTARLFSLNDLGMDGTTLASFRELIKVEHGLILVTGPTGSGKSTTLYAALSEIDSKENNAVTLEDPIEYQLRGISQTQINTKKGMTFASGLRSVLRQDPDIIMVGEIRDQETAVMAVQSAMTGHLVFSTLHTNDAASAVARMLDLGIESYLAASSLVAVLAQRLIRRVCSQCAEPITLSDAEWKTLGLDENLRGGCKAMRGKGCDRCRGSGYFGRIGIYELLVVSESIRSLIQNRTRSSEIRQQGEAEGMCLLRDSGIAKVYRGETTLEEVARITMRTEM